jgi:hypothetical protein
VEHTIKKAKVKRQKVKVKKRKGAMDSLAVKAVSASLLSFAFLLLP